MIDYPAHYLVAAMLLVLPLATLSILLGRHDSRAVALWCMGGLAYGIGSMLISLRGVLPNWLALGVASLSLFAAHAFRVATLGRESGARSPLLVAYVAWCVAALAYVGARRYSAFEAGPLLVSLTASLVGTTCIAWRALGLRRRHASRSAGMIAAAFIIFSLAIVLRAVIVATDWRTARAMQGEADLMLILLAGLVAELYADVGYIGMALERYMGREVQRTAELARAQEQRLQADLRAREMGALLGERESLLHQREEMLASLAHEVRQPLNNASAALQSAAQALPADDGDPAGARLRLQRAASVLNQVTAALDNTLSDAVLLSGDTPITRQDVDIDMVIQLAVGDIDFLQRDRIRIERATGTRTASMNAGLMRLALRNLLVNALSYAPAGSPVTVCISDLDEPLAVVLEVRDEGPGFPEELRSRLFSRGARGVQVNNRLGHGLGLFIVRRVAELHGGTVTAAAAVPRGASVTLVIPQV